MATRRMISKEIFELESFRTMPASSKTLYAYLVLWADDEGFVGNPLTVVDISKCTIDDLNFLILKNFVIGFDTGVVVVTDWNAFNKVQPSRFQDTKFKFERLLLKVSTDGRERYIPTSVNESTDVMRNVGIINKFGI